MTSKEKLEIVGIPETGNVHKAVQLRLDGKPILLIGGELHSQSLEEFLMSRQVPYERELSRRKIESGLNPKNPEILAIFGIPKRTGERYEVKGMGNIHLYTDRKIFAGFDGSSYDYEIEPDPQEEKLAIKAFRELGWE